MNLVRSVAVFFLALMVLVTIWNTMFTISPEREAVVLRFGEVDRVVGPGLRFRLPVVERVVVYDTVWERRLILRGPFEFAGCPAQVEAVYSIGDVLKFHEVGSEMAALDILKEWIRNTMAASRSDTTVEEVTSQMRGELADLSPAGLRVSYLSVTPEDCDV
jgi:hypothetical protein